MREGRLCRPLARRTGRRGSDHQEPDLGQVLDGPRAFEFVSEHRAVHAVATMCRVLEVSPSGYYAGTERKLVSDEIEYINYVLRQGVNEDRREGISAFDEKREPRSTGR